MNLLCKGKRKDNGNWIEGYLIQGTRSYIATVEATKDMVVSASGMLGVQVFEVIPESICVYSEKNDKNGEKLFNGDVVKCTFPKSWPQSVGVCEVVFRDCSFGLLWTRPGTKHDIEMFHPFSSLSSGTKLQKMGNVHDLYADSIRLKNEMDAQKNAND